MTANRFHLEDRLRSFARMITRNESLRVTFTGTQASISSSNMYIPPLEDTPEAFNKAKFLVAHECGHDVHSDLAAKEQATKRSVFLADILNSLEDARVERLMTEQFEGLHPLFEEEIAKIIAENDYATIPMSVQALHGLYLLGKGYSLEPIRKDAADMVASLEPLVKQAVNANDSFEVLKVSRKVYRALKRLERGHKIVRLDKAYLRGANLPDMVMDSLGEYKLPPDHDRMDDYPFLKDENVEERETETVPGSQPLSEYNALINRHIRHQSYLIQHLKSIIETKRRRSKKKSMKPSHTGTVDVRRLWRLATGETMVMRQRVRGPSDDTDPDSLAVYILLDESHSMCHSDRMRYAREAIAVLGEVLNALNIPFAITGYTVQPGLRRILYKRFGESYYSVRTRIADATHRSGTYTQEHIPYALRRLSEVRKWKKILLVVTDAEEIESDVRFRRAVDMAKEAGVELLGLGINTSTVQAYFDRFVELIDLQGFSQELLKMLRGVLAR